jgi:hypothetical protein
MIYIAAGLILFFVLAGAGRRARQRQMVQSLKRHFIDAKASLGAAVPALAAQLSEEQLSRAFDWIYAEHLRRSGARNFGDLLRKGQQADLNLMSVEICFDAAEKICAARPGGLAADSYASDAGTALWSALNAAGPEMYAEMVPNG